MWHLGEWLNNLCWKEQVFIYNIPTLGEGLKHFSLEPSFPKGPSTSHAPQMSISQKQTQ